MAVAASKVRPFTADGQSDIKILRGIVFSSTTAADRVDLKNGGSGGAILLTYHQPTALATIAQTFADGGVECPEGNWYVEVTTATTFGVVTLIGD